jgi:hypothetical protein
MHVAIYTPVVSNVDDRRLRIEQPSSMFDLRPSILDPRLQVLEPATRFELAQNPHRGCCSAVELRGPPNREDRQRWVEDRAPLRCYTRFPILDPQSEWSEPESNGPLLLFRQVLIRLSYPTSAAGRNRTRVDELRKLAPHPLGHGSQCGGDYGTRTHPSGLQDPHAADNI